MNIIKKSFGLFFVFSLLISNLYVPKVSAKTLGDLKQELKQFKEEYEENKKEQNMTEEEMINIKTNINKIEQNIVDIGDEIVELDKQIVALNEEIVKSESEIESILSFVQIQNGESAYLEYAFGAKDFTDFIYRIAVSEQLTTYNDELVEQYKTNIEENKKKTKELEEKKVNLNKQQENLQAELVKMNAHMQELDELNLSIEEQIALYTSKIELLEEKGCKDSEDIDTCGRNMLPSDTKMWRPLKSGSISGVLGLFGPRAGNSIISSYHHGLDMSASGANTGNVSAYSVANGIVLQVFGLQIGSNGKYKTQCGGRKVFILHNINGQQLISGYLHLRSVNVKKGDIVTKDTVIGTIGGYPHPNYEYYDSCSTGAHLHLEISTGNFDNIYNPSYYAYRTNPAMYINFPSRQYLGTYWTDRTTYLK